MGNLAVDRVSRTRVLIYALFLSHNRNNGVNFAGAPVRGQHRKPCTDCGTNFHSFDAGYYYTDTLSPWGADKLCSDCMAERLGGYFADAPGGYGDEEDY